MGQIKRTLRGWKNDVENVWGRLRTFHRVALGLTLGMLVIYVARARLLDPMQKELTETHKSMDDKGVPRIVPTPEEDAEVEELQLKLEDLQASSAQWRHRQNAALAKRPQINVKNRGDVLSELELLIVESGMKLMKRSPYPPVVEPGEMQRQRKQTPKELAEIEALAEHGYPLTTWAHQYELIGSFASVCDCLTRLSGFTYPAQIRRTEITLAQTANGQTIAYGSEPVIRLHFLLGFYYHDQ